MVGMTGFEWLKVRLLPSVTSLSNLGLIPFIYWLTGVHTESLKDFRQRYSQRSFGSKWLLKTTPHFCLFKDNVNEIMLTLNDC